MGGGPDAGMGQVTLHQAIRANCFGCREGISVGPDGCGGLVHVTGAGKCANQTLREKSPGVFEQWQQKRTTKARKLSARHSRPISEGI